MQSERRLRVASDAMTRIARKESGLTELIRCGTAEAQALGDSGQSGDQSLIQSPNVGTPAPSRTWSIVARPAILITFFCARPLLSVKFLAKVGAFPPH